MSGMRKLVVIATLAILLAGLVMLGSQDKRVSVADTDLPDDEVTGVSDEAGHSSATASIAITMYTESDE